MSNAAAFGPLRRGAGCTRDLGDFIHTQHLAGVPERSGSAICAIARSVLIGPQVNEVAVLSPLAPDVAPLSLCAEIAVRAVAAPTHSPAVWLHAMSEHLRQVLVAEDQPPSFDIRLAFLRQRGNGPVTVLSLGHSTPRQGDATGSLDSGGQIALLESALLLGARPDWSAFVHKTGESRRALLSSSAWEEHPTRQARVRIGLDEFIVHVAGLDDPQQELLLTLQLDRHTDGVWREGLLEILVPVLCRMLARIAYLRVWRTIEHRERLLERLTECQRDILPHLLRGIKEEEIAAIVHRSKHTIHDHVKSIYSAFEVSTRRDLLVRWCATGESDLETIGSPNHS